MTAKERNAGKNAVMYNQEDVISEEEEKGERERERIKEEMKKKEEEEIDR